MAMAEKIATGDSGAAVKAAARAKKSAAAAKQAVQQAEESEEEEDEEESEEESELLEWTMMRCRRPFPKWREAVLNSIELMLLENLCYLNPSPVAS